MKLDNSQIPVVIMCGGKGTRIRGVSPDLPKPMIPVGGKPIIWHIMKIYSSFGFRRFILCLGYKGWVIKDFFLKYNLMISDVMVNTASGEISSLKGESIEDWDVSLVDTGLNSGTGYRLDMVKDLIDNDIFMLSYGDGLADLDLSTEVDLLRETENLGIVCGVSPTSRYGELEVEGELVKSFAEKPKTNGWVSAGFFCFRKQFLKYLLDEYPEHYFEHEPLQKLAAEGRLGVYKHTGFWLGMDTFREFEALNNMWEFNQAPWKVWE